MIRAAGVQRQSPHLQLMTEEVACGVCGQPDRRRLFTEQYRLGEQTIRLSINRCSACGQVYVSPRLDRGSTEQVYRFDEHHTISHNYCWSGQTSDERFSPLLDRLETLAPSGRLLDVGCGSGSFLQAAQARGRWQLIGIEPSRSAAAQAQTRVAAPILTTTLERSTLPRQHFDVIALLGVLEHLHDPCATLQLARRLLKPNGVVAIYVPNFHYLRLKDTGVPAWVRRRRWSCLAPQEHLFHFTPRLLRQLLTRCGLEVVRLDVGRPFMPGQGWQRWWKEAAFAASFALHRSTGIHLGGLEAVACRRGTESVRS